jgi:hypothetical protein
VAQGQQLAAEEPAGGMAPGQRLAGEKPAGKVAVTRAGPRATLSDLTTERPTGRILDRGARVRAASPAEAGPAP